MIVTKGINACTTCGTQKIEISDCGYTTFNPGKAVCLNCGKKVPVSNCDWNNPDKDLICHWNSFNPKPQTIIEFIDKKIDELKKEKKRLKKLFKI